MAKRSRVKVRRSDEELVSACEMHLQELREALGRYPEDPERFIKRLTGALRQLVCETQTNKPLLLNLMDKFAFPVDVPPPTKPHRRPIRMVGWTQEMEREVRAVEGPTALKRLAEEREAADAAAAHPVPFREVINRGLAIGVLSPDGHHDDLSYKDLILAVAHQLGGAHEDDAVDERLAHLRSFSIADVLGVDEAILRVARLTLQIGRGFIAHMATKRGYEPRYFQTRPAHASPPLP